MKRAPDPDIAAIFQGLADMIEVNSATLSLRIETKNGRDFETRFMKNDLSAHQGLAMMQHLKNLEEVLFALPLVAQNELPVSALVSTERKYNHRTPLEFVVRISGFDITKPASRRWRTAAEMLSRTRARLGEVQAACDAQARPPSSWLVQVGARSDRIVSARSAREAAWLYGALCPRSRKEICNWKDISKDFRRVSEIAPDESWRDLS